MESRNVPDVYLVAMQGVSCTTLNPPHVPVLVPYQVAGSIVHRTSHATKNIGLNRNTAPAQVSTTAAMITTPITVRITTRITGQGSGWHGHANSLNSRDYFFIR